MRSVLFAGLALWGSLAIGCKGSKETKPTREECTQAGEHIADIIMKSSVQQSDAWFDAIKAAPNAEAAKGLPSDLTKTTFKVWLDSPEGRTWVMQRRTSVLIGVQQVVDQCVENATKAQVTCLMSATSKDDVVRCDEKFKRKTPAAEPAGSAGSGEISAPPPSDKPFVPPPVPPNQMAPGEYGPAGTTGSAAQ